MNHNEMSNNVISSVNQEKEKDVNVLNNQLNIINNEMNLTNNEMNFIDLESFGFTPYFKDAWQKRYNAPWENQIAEVMPARVIADHGHKVKVISCLGECIAIRPKHEQLLEQEVAVGDWVAIRLMNQNSEAMIEAVLPRITKFSRAAAGVEVKEQIVASNIDVVFLVQSLNNNFNIKRLERYLIAAWESGALPIVILTKSDLCETPALYIQQVEAMATGVAVHAVSNLTGEGIDDIKKYIKYCA